MAGGFDPPVRRYLIMNDNDNFYGHFLSTADSNRAVSYWRKDVHLVLVKAKHYYLRVTCFPFCFIMDLLWSSLTPEFQYIIQMALC